MKKLIVILMIVLLLCGCTAAQEQGIPTEVPEQTQTPTQEMVISLYDADSEIEESTVGAVRAYPLGDGIHTDLVCMGDKLMVVSAGGDITLLQGEEGQILATEATDLARTQWGLPIRTTDHGAGYYIPQSGEIALLDSNLTEIARIPAPEEMLGDPVILLQRNEVFYCTLGQIRAMDIQTGISRLVRSHDYTEQQLTGGFFNDTVLGCRLTDEQGAQKVIYIYADTGEMVAEDITQGTLYTEGAAYYALRSDGIQTQILFGEADGETMCLETVPDGLIPVLPLGGAIRCTADEAGLTLSFYDFETGKRSAEVSLPGLTMPIATVADKTGFWFIIDQMLYRWDPQLSLIEDETVYVSPLYTPNNPDTQGLDQCVARAQQMSTDYAIDIRVWNAATEDTGTYKCQSEYRVSSNEKALNGIETILKQLPEGFLTTTGNIRVNLVRSVNDGQTPMLYWQGSTCCLLLPSETAEEGFLWGLGNAIDARVLGNSRELDTWSNLNPRGFKYTYDYAQNAEREDVEDYLDDFVDLTAMSYPTEDRARIFMAAMLPENAELFQKDTLQDKLERLCKGIREAYNAEDDTAVFPWEQYLDEPIAAEE